MKLKLRVGGVPEHFNLPWHLALENDIFSKSNIDLEWIDFKGGTGAMTKALRENEIDLCVLLTEGIVADIIHGNPSRIISSYVNTPLIWGIHTGINSVVNLYGDIFDKKYAISRYGSGSHLMAKVDAFYKQKPLADEQFVVINNLDNALESLKENSTEVFYWEKFTTKPYVDGNEIRRIGEYITPWPCFQIAATNEILEKAPEQIEMLLNTIQFVCGQFMKTLDAVDQVSTRYKLIPEDAEQWFYSTEWSTNKSVSKKMLKNVIYTLNQAGIIESDQVNPDDLRFKF